MTKGKNKGLASLKRWKKCQRRVAKSVLRAVPKAKRDSLRGAANKLAALACSKGLKRTKKSRAGRGMRSSVVRTRGKRFSPPDFAVQLPYRPPEPPFNPEVF